MNWPAYGFRPGPVDGPISERIVHDGESGIFMLGLVIAAISLRWFNALADKRLTIPWTDLNFALVSLSFIGIVSFIAGSYPAMYLSAMNPVRALKGSFTGGRSAALPRRLMVIFQFTISIVLTIGTILIFMQIQHAKDRPVGYDREGIIHLEVRTEALAKANYNALRQELLEPGQLKIWLYRIFRLQETRRRCIVNMGGKGSALRPLVAMNSCSHDFPKTNGFNLLRVGTFPVTLVPTLQLSFNELAAKLISDENVIGKSWCLDPERKRKLSLL